MQIWRTIATLLQTNVRTYVRYGARIAANTRAAVIIPLTPRLRASRGAVALTPQSAHLLLLSCALLHVMYVVKSNWVVFNKLIPVVVVCWDNWDIYHAVRPPTPPPSPFGPTHVMPQTNKSNRVTVEMSIRAAIGAVFRIVCAVERNSRITPTNSKPNNL